jgi:ATP phosphoribosyltransferase regulatory subunit
MKSKNLSESILRSVKSKGFKYIDLPSVIEANHIVQRSGENFRKFIFSFTDQNGSELCLRPDLTIASCLRYLENNLKGKEKIFYLMKKFLQWSSLSKITKQKRLNH